MFSGSVRLPFIHKPLSRNTLNSSFSNSIYTPNEGLAELHQPQSLSWAFRSHWLCVVHGNAIRKIIQTSEDIFPADWSKLEPEKLFPHANCYRTRALIKKFLMNFHHDKESNNFPTPASPRGHRSEPTFIN